jgi:phosphoglycerate dehydrogenase-like enzyme
VAKFLEGFDFTVLLSDPFVSASDPIAKSVELVDLDTLMARSDVVSIHAPSLPSTRAMIGGTPAETDEGWRCLYQHGAGCAD